MQTSLHPMGCTTLLVLMLSVAACGGGSSGGAAAPPTASDPPPAGPSPPPPTAPAPPPAGPPSTACAADPVEPAWSEGAGNATRIKSPAPHMRFTAGLPLRILADAYDVNAWRCPPGHPPYVCQGSQERFYVDGQPAGAVPMSPTDFNLWELRLPNGLAAGDHVLGVDFIPFDPATGGGANRAVIGQVPVTIHVDPPPVHARTVTLTQDLVLGGSIDLDWTDTTVIGNGHSVSASAGYVGRVLIRNAFVSGLGSFSLRGMTVRTSGSVSIQDSVFEATGAMLFGVQGNAPLTVRNNELRANNLVAYVASDPSVPVVLQLDGNTTGAKVLQGNRIGGGMVLVNGGSGWQIGGLGAGEGNIMIGPRGVVQLAGAPNAKIQGNYIHHDYRGGFSQGYNLWFQGATDQALAEHNVLRGGSWPVQNFGGEFRYNLVVDSGHTFWRGAVDNTRIHHNIFTHASGPDSQFNGAIQVYGGERGISVYNNSFDGGGAIGRFDAPVLNIGPGSLFPSVRNNLMLAFSDTQTGLGRALVSSDNGTVTGPRVGSADYNAWYNPLATKSARYLTGIVQGTPGAHDVLADPRLSFSADVPYRVPEGCVWDRSTTVGQVLARYRQLYRPATGSPLIGAGDPADGAGTTIGAVGGNDSNPADLLGRIVP